MLGKCLWVSAALVMLAVADPDSGAGPAVRTAEPGNWTVDNCIVLKMSAQVRIIENYQCFGSGYVLDPDLYCIRIRFGSGSVLDPDPFWIQIQSGRWREGKGRNDP
jgi:hypothetical protein